MWDRVSEPSDGLKPEVNAARIYMFVDTNFIGAVDPSVAFLLRCRREGWIRIERTDIIDTEYLRLPPELGYKRDLASELAEVFTPFVPGHSRLDNAVAGSSDDENRFQTAFRILHPGADLETTRKNNIRDAMTVSGSARYGGDYLVTGDKGILAKSDALHDALAIRCLNSDDMAAVVLAAIERTVKNEPLTGWPDGCPSGGQKSSPSCWMHLTVWADHLAA